MKLCSARVMHRRVFPVRYRFAYRVFSVLLDIDRLRAASERLRLFSHNRFNLLSFHDADHGPRDGSPLRPWIEARLRGHAGIELAGGRVRLLCFPRVLGHGFSPISLWFCEHADGGLCAVLCEVRNTFGESHSYLLHDDGATLSAPVRAEKVKCFHVSPFIDMDASYRFRIGVPGPRFGFAIRQYQHERHLLSASYEASLRPATDAALLRQVASVPLLGLKVVTLIHWQALLIWLRGAPFFSKPEPPVARVS